MLRNVLRFQKGIHLIINLVDKDKVKWAVFRTDVQYLKYKFAW